MERTKEQLDLIRTASQQLNYDPLSIRKRDWRDWESDIDYNPQEWDSQEFQKTINPWSCETTGLYANIDAARSDNSYDPTSFFEGLSDFTLVGKYEVPQTDHVREGFEHPQILRKASDVDTYGSIHGQSIANYSERVSLRGVNGVTIGREAKELDVEDSIGADIARGAEQSWVRNCYGSSIGFHAEDTDIRDCVAEHTIGECAEDTGIHNSIGRRLLETAHDSVATNCVADKIGGEADGVPVHEVMPGKVYAKECVANTYGANVMVAQDRASIDDHRTSFRQLPSKPDEVPGENAAFWGFKDDSLFDKHQIY